MVDIPQQEQFKQHYINGRTCVRITVSARLVHAFASLLYACISTANRKLRRRRGSASLAQNCLTGMGGQLAVLFWLRYIGLPAQMALPSPAPDAGFDIATYGDMFKIDVKTSCFADGRGFDAVTGADRLPLPRKSRGLPHFYFWCVVAPASSYLAERLVVDLVATLPAGAITPWKKPRCAPPGMRLHDIDSVFSPPWFVKRLGDALYKIAAPSPLAGSINPAAAVAWAKSEDLLIEADANPTDVVMVIAQRMFDQWISLAQ